MGFKNKIKGLDENEIKLFVKRSILDGTHSKILKSKTLEKSQYLQEIVLEATNEIGDLIDDLKDSFECPIEIVKFLENSLKK
jgi:hypothetical protein